MWKSALAVIALYRKSLGICPGVSVQNMLGIGVGGQRPVPGACALTLHRLTVRCVMGRVGEQRLNQCHTAQTHALGLLACL